MRAYLAGPMRGKAFLNFPAFWHGASFLRGAGHEVISPAEIDEEEGFVKVFVDESGNLINILTTELFTIEKALNGDFQAITEVDSIVFLPGWLDSAGCKAEYFCAMATGKDFYTFNPEKLELTKFNPSVYDVVLTVDSHPVVV